jgi:hypothetical protein
MLVATGHVTGADVEEISEFEEEMMKNFPRE